MIQFKCRFCGGEIESPQSMAGHMETCPACGRMQAVPRQGNVLAMDGPAENAANVSVTDRSTIATPADTGGESPEEVFKRVIVERIAFTFVAPLLFTVILGVCQPSAFGPEGPGFIGIYLIGVAVVGGIFIGGKEFAGVGGYTEVFPADAVPERARKTFDLLRFFLEFLYFIGVCIALVVVMGIIALFQWAFSEK